MITVAEASAKYGLSDGWLRKLIRSGQVRARRVGARVWLIDERSLQRYASSPVKRKRGPKPKRRA